MNNKYLEEPDFTVVMIPYFAEVIAADISDSIRILRFDAMKQVQSYLSHYEKLGYMPKLLCAIAEKKCEYIMAVTTKADAEQIVKPCCPHYDGNGFIPGQYSVPEEEMICWSETSLKAPLNSEACKRYLELFKQVLPEESKLLPF